MRENSDNKIENESSDRGSDIVLAVKNREIRIIDSESESDSDETHEILIIWNGHLVKNLANYHYQNKIHGIEC